MNNKLVKLLVKSNNNWTQTIINNLIVLITIFQKDINKTEVEYIRGYRSNIIHHLMKFYVFLFAELK